MKTLTGMAFPLVFILFLPAVAGSIYIYISSSDLNIGKPQITWQNEKTDSVEQLVARADKVMYKMKKSMKKNS